jgi:hypothetical protein
MTDLIASLATVSNRYDAVFCDLWGCLHNGKVPFPAAVAALRAFRAKGDTSCLLTNSPRPRNPAWQQIAAIGVPDDCWDDIVSSGDASQYGLLSGAVGPACTTSARRRMKASSPICRGMPMTRSRSLVFR